jgi:putative PIN family toxin of toxin-antitoxin system
MSRKVVLDTNVVLSALLFEEGHMAWLRHAWQEGRCLPLGSSATIRELARVLRYPKFELDENDRMELLGDYLPFVELLPEPPRAPAPLTCRDPDDQKFLDLAAAASADFLVTGDGDLLALAPLAPFGILRPSEARGRM